MDTQTRICFDIRDPEIQATISEDAKALGLTPSQLAAKRFNDLYSLDNPGNLLDCRFSVSAQQKIRQIIELHYFGGAITVPMCNRIATGLTRNGIVPDEWSWNADRVAWWIKNNYQGRYDSSAPEPVLSPTAAPEESDCF